MALSARRPVDSLAAPADAEANDADLLRQCAIVRLFEQDGIEDDGRWAEALRRVAGLRPTTVAGLQAKVQVALAMMPFGSAAICPDWASPDEALLWSLLHDMLALAHHE